MSCRDYQDRFVLSLYEELPDHERVRLEAHLHECVACADALEAQKAFHEVMAEDATQWEVPADLLVESRRALANELDRVEQKREWWRVPAFSVVLTPMRMLESGALIAMGLALGVYITHQQAVPIATVRPAESSVSVVPRNSVVSNLRIVNSDPSDGTIELAGEVVQPLSIQGKMEDELVRGLLFSAMRDTNNPGSRLRATEVLAESSSDHSIQEVLAHALVHDSNPGVRMKALESLRPFVGQSSVREAFMQALRNDEVSGIRVAAVEALTEASKDENMFKSIQEVTKDDDNAYIRMMGVRFVGNRQ
jgi:hypothetical protein